MGFNYQSLLALLLFLNAAASLPSTFDVRFQPASALYTDYQAQPVTVCEAYGWAKQLAQILSNAASVALEEKVNLSGQNIVECISFSADMCRDSQLQDIKSGLRYISEKGITEVDCYPQNFYELPSEYCRRSCKDGEPFIRTFKAVINRQNDLESLLTRIGNAQVLGIAVIKLYEVMNYYSPEDPQNMKKEGMNFGFSIGEIVGWKKQGREITVRIGSAGWGYKGYADIGIGSGVLQEIYSLSLLGYSSSTKSPMQA